MPLREETLRKNTEPTLTIDREERTSFASLKEDRSAVAQSFLDSRISSYATFPDDAIDESDSDRGLSPVGSLASSPVSTPTDPIAAAAAAAAAATTTVLVSPAASAPPGVLADSQVPSSSMASALGAPLTNPASNLHPFVCPCDGFRGWKEIPVRGKMASRSFSDLRVFTNKGFRWEPTPPFKPAPPMKPSTFAAGEAPLEKLPTELLGAIIDHMVEDIPPNGLQPRNIDLMALLLTSRALHSATLATLYKQVTIPHSTVFRKLLHHIKEYPALGTIVRRLDFSHFNPTGSGVTARQRAETQNLTQKTMLECLELLPNLREFLAQEHIDEELSVDVLRRLFNNPQLRALDFCAASSAIFRTAMMTVVRSPGVTDLPELMPIQRLSFHECTILPSIVLETLLPRLPNLTHLDVAHTRITDRALALIPETARLSHLNLSKCQSLSGDAVVAFLSTHPSAKELVYLNLHMDAKSAELLAANHVTALLSILPSTLKSLNLKGSAMDPSHLPILAPLTKHVEELGLGRNLTYTSLVPLLRPPTKPDELAKWTPHALRYIDISDMEPDQLDFSALFGRATTALDDSTLPLEVIEVCQRVYDRFLDRERTLKAAAWVVKEAGRRGWLVRDLSKAENGDDGARSWKMGATYWGMRKVPVARAEVGGMYGLYMFKR